MADSGYKAPTRVRKPGDIANTQKKCWHGILVVYQVLLDPQSNRQTRLRAAEKLGRLCQQYKDIIVSSDMEKRIEAIEETLKKIK